MMNLEQTTNNILWNDLVRNTRVTYDELEDPNGYLYFYDNSMNELFGLDVDCEIERLNELLDIYLSYNWDWTDGTYLITVINGLKYISQLCRIDCFDSEGHSDIDNYRYSENEPFLFPGIRYEVIPPVLDKIVDQLYELMERIESNNY